MDMKVVLAGASGLIGGHALDRWLQEEAVAEVVSLVRRATNREHAKLREVVVDFDRLDDHGDLFKADIVCCCLGTTIGKAGSKEAFRKVDEQYPLEMARLAEAGKAGVYSIVTAMGADPGSMIFYNRVKGDVEAALEKMDIPSMHVLQPSMLLGERDEQRLGESVGKVVMKATGFLMVGPLKKYRAIQGDQVAKAMVDISLQAAPGFHRHTSDELALY